MSLQKKFFPNLIYLSLFFLVAYGFSYIFIGSFHSQANAEDLSLCAAPLHKGLINSTIDILRKYDGRYFTNLLHGLNPLAFGFITGYKWTTIFTSIFGVFSLFFFLSGLVPLANRLKLLLFSALFFVCNYSLSSSLAHQLFWMVSSFVYSYSWYFWLIWLGTLFRWNREKKPGWRIFLFVLSHLFLIAAVGINEIFLLLHAFSLIALYVYFYKQNRENILAFQSIFITGIFSIIFFLSQPGISIRFGSFETLRPENYYSLIFLKSLNHQGKEWLRMSTQGLVMLSMSYLAMVLFKKFYQDFALKMGKAKLFLTLFLVLFGLYLSSFAFYIPMGHEEFLPIRIFSTLNFGFQLAFIIFIPSIILAILPEKYLASKTKMAFSLFAVLSLITFLHFGNNNIHNIRYDFESGKLKLFSEQMSHRYLLIEQAKNTQLCWKKAIVPPLQNIPYSIYSPPDIQENKAAFYWNNAYEIYFQIDEISLEGDSIGDAQYVMQNL
ncbi:MAG: hypothetical protein H6579_05125 [Chitinophagales bacterium]|nr:hypothetical protein [Chitinophagales bacterium]